MIRQVIHPIPLLVQCFCVLMEKQFHLTKDAMESSNVNSAVMKCFAIKISKSIQTNVKYVSTVADSSSGRHKIEICLLIDVF